MRCSIIVFAIAGCAVPPPLPIDGNALQSIVGTRVAGQPQRCVAIVSPRDGLQAIDSRTLFYRTGHAIWVNQLPDDCPRLRPHSNLVVNLVGNRYCSGDSMRVLDAGSDIPVAVCALGDFTPYR